ncbi:MAG TPA: hypothetical protein VNA27_07910 [Rubrobacteraceae bacterium]|nr:hypothetical protein [Rubrobacteraceae bacterium]
MEYLEAVEESELAITLHREAEMGKTEKRQGQFYGPNLGYVGELYKRYRRTPNPWTSDPRNTSRAGALRC